MIVKLNADESYSPKRGENGKIPGSEWLEGHSLVHRYRFIRIRTFSNQQKLLQTKSKGDLNVRLAKSALHNPSLQCKPDCKLARRAGRLDFQGPSFLSFVSLPILYRRLRSSPARHFYRSERKKEANGVKSQLKVLPSFFSRQRNSQDEKLGKRGKA